MTVCLVVVHRQRRVLHRQCMNGHGNRIQHTCAHARLCNEYCGDNTHTHVLTHTHRHTHKTHGTSSIVRSPTRAHERILRSHVFCVRAHSATIWICVQTHAHVHTRTNSCIWTQTTAAAAAAFLHLCVIAMQLYAPVKLYNFHSSQRRRRMGATAQHTWQAAQYDHVR